MSAVAIMFTGLTVGVFVFIGAMAIRQGLIYVADAIKAKK